MKKNIIKIEYIFDEHGSRHSVKITRGSYYTVNFTRTYKINELSDAAHNLSIMLSNRDKWTTFFYKTSIVSFPAWFTLREGGVCRAAGTLEHCKNFFKAGMKIVRRTDYPMK